MVDGNIDGNGKLSHALVLKSVWEQGAAAAVNFTYVLYLVYLLCSSEIY
jgi:hypothetical protein